MSNNLFKMRFPKREGDMKVEGSYQGRERGSEGGDRGIREDKRKSEYNLAYYMHVWKYHNKFIILYN
jgi:hypothetical protein